MIDKQNIYRKPMDEREFSTDIFFKAMFMCEFSQPESPIEWIFWEAIFDEAWFLVAYKQIFPQYIIKPFRVDFALPVLKIAVELDGHEYHSGKLQREKDAKRTRFLQEQGWKVVRFTGTEIYHDVWSCVEQLKKMIHYDIWVKRITLRRNRIIEQNMGINTRLALDNATKKKNKKMPRKGET